MAKAKRKRAKRKNPKRSHARRVAHKRRRAVAANPKRARRVKRRRHAVSNPRKRSHRRRHARRAVANPVRRRRSLRRSRRNPGVPVWAMAGLAAAAGLGIFAIATDGSFALTQRTDPTLATLQRNRYILSGVLTLGGLALAAYGSPMIGAGVTAGGLAALAGTQASLALGHVLDKTNPDGSLQTAQPAPAPAKINGVFSDGRQMLGAVYSNASQMIGGVYGDGQQMIGAGYGDDPAGYFGG